MKKPGVTVFPGGLEDEAPSGPPTAVITDRGFVLVLRFGEGDFAGTGPLRELRVIPEAEAGTIEPKALRRFAPDAELYLAYARSAMGMFGPGGDPKTRRENVTKAADSLRELAGPGRGLKDAFFMKIAEHYTALVAEGEPHPIKTLGERHNVTISAASRWVKESRRLGYLDPKEGK